MAQHTGETDRESESKGVSEVNIDRSLSSKSRRQRDGADSIGAFGGRTGSSDLVFFEGITPKFDDNNMNDYSTKEQTAACFDRLESLLSRRGLGLENLMKLQVQLTDPDAARGVDEVYESRFDDGDFPPRTVVGVCWLPNGVDIQLDVVAAEE